MSSSGITAYQVCPFLLAFTFCLEKNVFKTSDRCTTQPAKMSIDSRLKYLSNSQLTLLAQFDEIHFITTLTKKQRYHTSFASKENGKQSDGRTS